MGMRGVNPGMHGQFMSPPMKGIAGMSPGELAMMEHFYGMTNHFDPSMMMSPPMLPVSSPPLAPMGNSMQHHGINPTDSPQFLPDLSPHNLVGAQMMRGNLVTPVLSPGFAPMIS